MHAYTPMKGTSFTAVKSEKKIVQMLCLTTSVHTSIYQYILVCTITSHVFIQIRLEPPCETVSSPLPSCVVERPQRSSWPWFVRPSDHPSAAFSDETATATGLPRTHCCLAFHPHLQSLHSLTGMMCIEMPHAYTSIPIGIWISCSIHDV